jgi:hypothetical protein
MSGAALLHTVDQHTPLGSAYGYRVLLELGSVATTHLRFGVASIKVETPLDVGLGRRTGWQAFTQLGGPTDYLVGDCHRCTSQRGSCRAGGLTP